MIAQSLQYQYHSHFSTGTGSVYLQPTDRTVLAHRAHSASERACLAQLSCTWLRSGSKAMRPNCNMLSCVTTDSHQDLQKSSSNSISDELYKHAAASKFTTVAVPLSSACMCYVQEHSLWRLCNRALQLAKGVVWWSGSQSACGKSKVGLIRL